MASGGENTLNKRFILSDLTHFRHHLNDTFIPVKLLSTSVLCTAGQSSAPSGRLARAARVIHSRVEPLDQIVAGVLNI